MNGVQQRRAGVSRFHEGIGDLSSLEAAQGEELEPSEESS